MPYNIAVAWTHARDLALTLSCLVLVALAGIPAAASAAAQGDRIPGHYIVTVDKDRKASDVADEAGAQPKYVYKAALNGFAAELTDRQVEKLRRHPHVETVEQDSVASADKVQTMDVFGEPWGLDRIDQNQLPLSRTYTFATTAGDGVRAYVLDSGIETNHTEFGDRALSVFDGIGGTIGTDCSSHGTHVAGTIGGATFGVAKRVLLRSVRVLDCSGSGLVSGIIAGVDFVRANGIKPAVVNMSLGGGVSTALNNAVTNLSNAGFFVAVSAGNVRQDACNQSPASTPVAYTVAASDRADRRWLEPAPSQFGSNFGPCVDGYAPGAAIKSATRNGATGLLTGTSMASPHVAGVAAILTALEPVGKSPAQLTSMINTMATPGVIQGNPAGTVNRLLFKNSGL